MYAPDVHAAVESLTSMSGQLTHSDNTKQTRQ